MKKPGVTVMKMRKIAIGILLFLALLRADAYGDILRVFFLNAGEGDAIYIETPDRQRILIDAGNLITGYRVTMSLKSRGVNTIDALIITHPHPDHMGGVFYVVQEFDVKSHYDNGQSLSVRCDGDLYRWYADLFRRESYKALSAGDVLHFGKVIIRILSPERLGSNWNENSLVIKIIYGKISFLLMGDATRVIENILLNKSSSMNGLKSDVLKVGHHGAGDATSEKFLRVVSPEYAIVSVNKGNIRGYPSAEVLKRINDNGIRVFLTYRDADVVFESDGKTLSVVSAIPEKKKR
ncbi:comEC family competence protein [bacterium BMS3Abin07]|nr:comEC family competence protein [bacterium BMS3Abin07]